MSLKKKTNCKASMISNTSLQPKVKGIIRQATVDRCLTRESNSDVIQTRLSRSGLVTTPTVLSTQSNNSAKSLSRHPPTPIHVIRQSEPEDVNVIANLETSATKEMFGNVDISEFINMHVCKSMFNSANELVAFIAVADHPNIQGLRMCSWENWAKTLYRLDSSSPWNTLFIFYLVWDSRYPHFFIYFLKTLYKNNAHLEQIILIAPPNVPVFKEVASHFIPIFPQVLSSSHSTDDVHFLASVQTVCLNTRLSTIKKLVIRKAVKEDNIDIQPLLHSQYEVLEHVYGAFKLSEVIDLKDSNKAVLVAERDNHLTVGMISLTSAIDYQHVNTFFHIPLQDFAKMDHVEDHSRVISKAIYGHADWHIPRSLTIEDDFFSLKTGILNDREDDDATIFEEGSRSRSVSELYLEDSENDFRIIDPAMDYMMQLNREDGSSSQSESIRNVDSFESNTYFGRTGMLSATHSHMTLHRDHLTTNDKVQIPPFVGPKNGFQVCLFALHPDLDTRYAFDLLEAAFDCFPDKHYCLLSLPTSYQGSALIRHCVRMTPRLSWGFPHELYIVHRNSIFSEFSVRQVSLVDYDSVAELVDNGNLGRKILKDLATLLSENLTDNRGFVLECEQCIIGFALVIEGFQLEHTVPHFCLEEVLKVMGQPRASHGLLRHAVIAPVFLSTASFFLRQVLRLASLDSLTYCLLDPEIMHKMDLSITTVLGDLCPVQPRKRVQYDLKTEFNIPEDHVLYPDTEYALFLATEKTLSVPLLELNYRVVVVGGSDVALSFFEHLIFGAAKRHIRYNNLTLISQHGFPMEQRPHVAADRMNPHSGRYNRDYLTRLSLQTHVNILHGVLNVIDRKEKMICLNGEYWMRYDYLFLFTGVQFCNPRPASLPETDVDGCQKFVDTRDVFTKMAKISVDNLFLINTASDRIMALRRLKKIVVRGKSGKILIYGNCINIFTCVESLLAFHVPGNRIVLIQSPDICPVRGLASNEVIDKAVLQSLQQAGVTVHFGYTLIGWTLKMNKTIVKVAFNSETKALLTLECLALFCYAAKQTCTKTYLALIDSGIVYNNGIIINNEFRTNDQHIFAAGPGTKYSSLYKNCNSDHGLYNSAEIGYQVSQVFRKLVEPPDPEHSVNTPTPGELPRLTWPITTVAKLPGGWNYVRISAPGTPLPLECQLHGQGDSGPVLITGDPTDPDGPGYFQLSLSVFNTVTQLVCLSKREIPHQNLECLYGKHERLLNSLVERYELGLISDLYSYFNQPWAYALYTTGFDDLVQQCAEMFLADEDTGQPVIKHLNSGQNLLHFDQDALDEVAGYYEKSSVPLYVQQLTKRYVSERALQLPMYMTDNLMEAIHHSYTSSPLHRSSKVLHPSNR